MARTVRAALPRERYRHVLGVARTAERLARRYGQDTRKARIAAMLHDIARMWSDEQLFDYMRLHKLPVTPAEREAPALLHARIGAHIAQAQFGIDDPLVLRAMERHTVAVPGMSDLEKILYIADSIEPSRGFAAQAQLAAHADRSLDEGMLACIKSSIAYLQSKGIAIAPETRVVEQELLRRGEA